MFWGLVFVYVVYIIIIIYICVGLKLHDNTVKNKCLCRLIVSI